MKKILALIAMVFLFASCSSVQTPLYGMLYTDAKAGNAVTGNVAGKKMGKACSRAVLGIATGDASISAAMKDGNIKQVSHVDQGVTNILGIFAENCTIVYGN